MADEPGTVRLRVVVTGLRDTEIPFGIQDKAGNITDPVARTADAATFEIDVALAAGDGRTPAFRGPYVHGTPSARFLYVSFPAAGGSGWTRRMKIPLSSVDTALIEAARDGCLEADVDGRLSGTVPVTWRATRR